MDAGCDGGASTVVVPIDSTHLLVSWRVHRPVAPRLRAIQDVSPVRRTDPHRPDSGDMPQSDLDLLPGRTSLLAHLQTALASCPPKRWIAVVACDVDPLKSVRSALGHEAGDAVLSVVANRLRQFAGRRAFAARLNWDEFALVLPPVGRSWSTAAFLQDLRESVAQPIRINAHAVEPTVSFGLHLAHGARSATPAQAQAALDVTVSDMYRSRRAAVHQDVSCGGREGRMTVVDGGGSVTHN